MSLFTTLAGEILRNSICMHCRRVMGLTVADSGMVSSCCHKPLCEDCAPGQRHVIIKDGYRTCHEYGHQFDRR
jgi:hypothetical protein